MDDPSPNDIIEQLRGVAAKAVELGLPVGLSAETIYGLLGLIDAAREEGQKAADAEVASLRHQLAMQSARNRERNLQLDALHFVWCNGGCATGVHRWTDGAVTEELVREAERNTRRLRTWWEHRRRKPGAPPPTVGEEPSDAVRLLWLDRPWSVPEILRRLVEDAEHLNHAHDCDHHGWEGRAHAVAAAKEWLEANAGTDGERE